MCIVLLVSLCMAQGTDSLNCRMVGHWPYGPGVMYKEVMSESLIYVHAGVGFYVLDVGRPGAVVKVAEVPTQGVPGFISRHGSRLCVGESDAGVALYDVTDLRHPALLGRYASSGAALGVAFDGRYALAACDDARLLVIDFADPAAPVLTGSCLLPGDPVDVVASGNVACVTAQFGGLCLVDITDLHNPALVGRYTRDRDAARVVRVADTVAYVTFDQGGMVILGISNPAQPNELSRFCPARGAGDLALQDTLVLVETFGWPRSIRAVSVADPRAPRALGTFRTLDGQCGFQGLAIDDQRAYTQWESGALDSLMVLDISDPTTMVVTASYAGIPPLTDDVVVVESLLLAGTRGDGLRLFDISNMASPVELGRVCDTTRVGRLGVRDGIAYLACWHGSILKTVDFSDPRHPVQVGMLDTFGYAHDIALQGTYAYLAEGEYLRIVDISDPSNPRQLSRLSLPSSSFGVDVADSFCYVANWLGGVRVVDVSDPANPHEVASYATPCSAAVDICVRPPYLYYADVGGFGVLKVGNPREPDSAAYVSTVPLEENWGLNVDGEILAATRSWGGVKLYDVTEPDRPVEVGWYDTPGWPYHLQQAGRLTYAADGEGFVVLEYLAPGVEEGSGSVLQPAPILQCIYDPTARMLRLQLPDEIDSARIMVVDATGRTRLVRSVARAAPGKSTIEVDVSGLLTGTYVVRLETPRWTGAGRFVVLH